MTDATVSALPESRATTGGAFYRLVWKWHFLASLYVLPFMIMLAITGGIYLFKPQIEEVIYASRLNVEATGDTLPYETQVAAVTEAVGIKRLRGVTIEDTPGRTTLIEFNDANNTRSYAWVNPYTAEVLAITPRDETAMRMLKKFHGELLLGSTGTKFVELAAHWAIVMFITGLYLWWPRGQRSLAKAVSLPSGKGRPWWRETHMFTGFLAAILVIPLLISGLPWTDVWGGGLSFVQEQTDQQSKSLRFGGGAPKSTASSGETRTYDAIFAAAKSEGLAAPYEMRPPKGDSGAYWIRSASRDRYEQTELVIDQYSGAVLARVDFTDNPAIAQAVALGVSFHQGELYGWVNLAQNVLAAVLAFVLAISGMVAWWKRKPAGSLGVPAAPEPAFGFGMAILVVALMILLPLMGASLIIALLLDQVIFQRLGWFKSAMG